MTVPRELFPGISEQVCIWAVSTWAGARVKKMKYGTASEQIA